VEKRMIISLFIDTDVLETRVAVIEDEQIMEIHIERKGESAIRGQVRRGRVTHISNDLQAATVDVGDGHSLFLRAADARVLGPADSQGKIPIGKLVTRGQNILVQPTRPGMDGKQGRCTADVALFGRYVTLHPMRQGLEAGKVEVDAVLSDELGQLADAVRVTLRPAARMVDAATIKTEAERLLADWQKMVDAVKGMPQLLRPAQDLISRGLTALAGPDPDVILTGDRGILAKLKILAAQIAPDLKDRIALTEPRRSVDLDEEVETSLGVVAAFEGGRLSIEPTRAMTVIDIDGQGQPTKVNLAAVPEIARQLRLRRIGGPVAIDFVTMSKAQDRKRIETALRQALARSVAQADVGSIDRFGIATLVLRRDGASLADDMTGQHPVAASLTSVAQLARVLRRAAFELSSVGPLPIVVELSDKLKSVAPADLAEQLSTTLNRPLKVSFGPRAVDDMALSRER
jgi:ribonuclease G